LIFVDIALRSVTSSLQASGINGDLNAVLSDEGAQRFVSNVATFAPRAREVFEGHTTPEALLSEFLAAVTPPGSNAPVEGESMCTTWYDGTEIASFFYPITMKIQQLI
jgi:hypothetical protein